MNKLLNKLEDMIDGVCAETSCVVWLSPPLPQKWPLAPQVGDSGWPATAALPRGGLDDVMASIQISGGCDRYSHARFTNDSEQVSMG